MTNFPVRFNPSVEFVHLCIVSCVKQSVPPEAVQDKIAATSMFDALGGAAYFLVFLSFFFLRLDKTCSVISYACAPKLSFWMFM